VTRERQTIAGRSEPAIFFRKFVRHIFGTFSVEASIIMRLHEVPYLFIDLKMLDAG